MAIYKALDIREVVRIHNGSATNRSYGASNDIALESNLYIICVAKDLETGSRVRFEFRPAETEFYRGKTYYKGYTGDYHLLIPGDTFELEQTDTYMHLTILDVK